MRKKKNIILCLISMLLFCACASSSKTYQLQALNEYQSEETDSKTTLTFIYNEDGEVVTYTSEETYQSSDEETMNDYLQRVRKSQTMLSQISGVEAESDVKSGQVTLHIEISFDKVDIAELLEIDTNFRAYTKDGKLNIDLIKDYLTEQGYSLLEEEVK